MNPRRVVVLGPGQNDEEAFGASMSYAQSTTEDDNKTSVGLGASNKYGKRSSPGPTQMRQMQYRSL